MISVRALEVEYATERVAEGHQKSHALFRFLIQYALQEGLIQKAVAQNKRSLVELLMDHAEWDSHFRARLVLTVAQRDGKAPDPNDEMVLETAINGRADAIVTFNDRDFRPVAMRFRCRVLRPAEVVRRLAEEAER